MVPKKSGGIGRVLADMVQITSQASVTRANPAEALVRHSPIAKKRPRAAGPASTGQEEVGGCSQIEKLSLAPESRRREQLVALAARHAVPAIYQFRQNAAVGGLMSYGTRITDTSYRLLRTLTVTFSTSNLYSNLL